MKITIELPKEFDADIMKKVAKHRKTRDRQTRQQRNLPQLPENPKETDEEFVTRTIRESILSDYITACAGEAGREASKKRGEELFAKIAPKK
jgi:hypothetical protein